MLRAPEVLLPAGSLAKMHAAFDYGADAVYAGQPRYSLRARNNEFSTLATLEAGITQAHARGKLFFVASNIFPHNAKLKTYLRDMEPVIAMKPDALIMADPGLIMMVREKWPEVPVHLSVQANAVNWADVKFWKSMGLTRVILSRELSLDEIEEIRQTCPDMELEVFVHGALCIAYSGRCLLSGYFNHRDPNQGTCTNSCRWDYKVMNASEDASGDLSRGPTGCGGGCSSGTADSNAGTACNNHDGNTSLPGFDYEAALQNASQPFSAMGNMQRHPLADQPYLIQQISRPGDMLPILEDEHGTYIMNSKDLRAVEHIERLVNIGIDSLKIEGRTKSLYYAARTAQVYRRAIDDAVAGRPFNIDLLGELQGLANRGYTDGFYQRHHTQEHQNYMSGVSEHHRSTYVGDVQSINNGWAEIDVKNRFAVGDQIEVIHPGGNQIFTLRQMKSSEGLPLDIAPGSGHRVLIELDARFNQALLARLL